MEKITNERFNALEWHDAIIEKIIIDRKNPGKVDTIVFFIVWTDGTKSRLCFEDVYWADLNMNFGVVALESIYSAFSEWRECEQVKDLYKKWDGFIDDINLNYYEIQTNSTGSLIKIISKGVCLCNNGNNREAGKMKSLSDVISHIKTKLLNS